MKILCTFLALLVFLANTSKAEDISDVSDLAHIKVLTNDVGIVVAGDVKSTMANYPALRTKLKAMLATKLAAEDELSAQSRLTKLTALGIVLPQSVLTAHATRIEALRIKKEAALLAVAVTNQVKDPTRALAKMNELIAAGVPISQVTQDAVKRAQPTPVAVPVTPPPPDDGL